MSLQSPYNSPQLTGSSSGESRFVAIGFKVMRGKEFICEARSTTMAQRIARALNLHKPTSRGI